MYLYSIVRLLRYANKTVFKQKGASIDTSNDNYNHKNDNTPASISQPVIYHFYCIVVLVFTALCSW